MVALLEKILVVRDPSASRDTRNMRLAVEVVMQDGTTHRGVCTAPPGSWGKPIDDAQHRAKVRDCLRLRYDEQSQSRILELLQRLEQLTADEVAQLMQMLA
jgi:2-methylcitrate dehydratase PrpD